MTSPVVKRTEDELANWLGTEAGFVGALCRYDDEPIELEPYQIAFLNNRSRFRWVTKSRQVGYSFVAALEALARCHLRDGHTSVFVSFNQDDAKEKVLVARQVFDEMPAAYQKRLIVDSKTELVFESNGSGRRVSRIISVPSKPPRGKKGDVLLDELAHYINDREVYSGSTALILRSHGQLTGCSTPLGRRGIFWEIAAEELRKYPHHSRQEVSWWLCRFFCRDVKAAADEAPHLSTEDQVARFGKQGIIEQFESLPLEDFEQEFCCRFVDESYSFYSFELILPCTSDDLQLADDFTDLPIPEGRIVAGFDVGRTRDRSELAVFENRDGRHICRLLRSYDQVPFSEQEADLRRLLEMLPVARLSVDRSGISATSPRSAGPPTSRSCSSAGTRSCPATGRWSVRSTRSNAASCHRARWPSAPSGHRAATPTASGPSRSPARRSAGQDRRPAPRSVCGCWVSTILAEKNVFIYLERES